MGFELKDMEREFQGGTCYTKRAVSVEFALGTKPPRAREIAREVGCGVMYIHSSDPDGKFGLKHDLSMVVVTPEGMAEDEAVARFGEYDEVTNAARLTSSMMANTDASAVPEEDETRSLEDYGEYYLDVSGFRKAWDVVKCNGCATVAVLDTGAPQQRVSDLALNVDYARAADFTQGCEMDPDVTDRDGHGTAVAGVVSAVAGNGEGLTGASWNALVLPVKVMEGESFENHYDGVTDALEYLLGLDDVPEVVNMSFSVRDDASTHGKIEEWANLVGQLRERGAVCVAASGNDNYAFPLSLLFGTQQASYPAALDGVVSVGALDALPDYNTYYHSGYPMESYDPGIWPQSNTVSGTDIVAHGSAVKVLVRGLIEELADEDYAVDSADGTSLAVPQVSAAAALLKAQHPDWNAEQVEGRLFATTRLPDDFSDETGPGGTGGPDGVDDQGRYGHGALDAAAAVGWSEPSGASPATGGSLAELFASQAGGAR